MRTSNPVLREDTFAPSNWGGVGEMTKPQAGVMTMPGTVAKTGFLLMLCIASALASAYMLTRGSMPFNPMLLLAGGGLGGFVLCLIISFKPQTAPFLAPVYAVLQGAFLGAFSLSVSSRVGPAGNTIVLQAVCITFGIFASLLVGYGLGLVRAGPLVTKIIVFGTMGVCMVYLVQMLLGFFGVHVLSSIHGSGGIGIGFSIVVVVLASLNLILDFQMVESGVRTGAPKYMEWYAGFGLLVTLIWLYIEVLRLLSKLNRR